MEKEREREMSESVQVNVRECGCARAHTRAQNFSFARVFPHYLLICINIILLLLYYVYMLCVDTFIKSNKNTMKPTPKQIAA